MNLVIKAPITEHNLTPQQELDKKSKAHELLPTAISNFLKNNWALLIISSLVYIGRVLTGPEFVESRDGLFFLRALDRYSVAELRPHWPGYPFYIWIGKLFSLVYHDHIQALHLVSILASTLSTWPIAGLTGMGYAFLKPGHPNLARRAGLAAALVWSLTPLSWLGGSEIFSDPLGLLMALVILWICCRSLENRSRAGLYLPLAAIISGLMLGTRLSYLALLLPLAYATWLNREQPLFNRSSRRFGLPLLVIGCFGMAIAVWLGWQFQMEGWSFLEAGDRHLVGHYTEWGGSVTTDKNVLTRPVRMFETLGVYGLGGWWPGIDLIRLPATLLLLVLAGTGSYRLVHGKSRQPLIIGLLWAGPYFLWILLGNDVDLVRYDFPLVALICVLAGLGLPEQKKLAGGVMVTVCLSMALITIPQAVEHRNNPHIGEKLVKYVNTNPLTGKKVYIVDDATSLLGFFLEDEAPGVYSRRITDDKLEQETAKLEGAGWNLYLTALPGQAPPGWFPVIRLCRGQFMESRGPLEVWVYRHGENKNGGAILGQCQ